MNAHRLRDLIMPTLPAKSSYKVTPRRIEARHVFAIEKPAGPAYSDMEVVELQLGKFTYRLASLLENPRVLIATVAAYVPEGESSVWIVTQAGKRDYAGPLLVLRSRKHPTDITA